MSPVFCVSGPAAGRTLAARGALAMAVSPNLILVGASFFRQAPARRRLTLAHELAHTRQLARPGADSISSLEDEAWEAAHAWTAGKPFTIRGRANQPLCALAITDDRAHPDADAWYALSTAEPIGARETVSVDQVQPLNRITLDLILDKILEFPDTRDVIIVAHGNDLGLSVPLIHGSEVRARREAIVALATDTASEVDGLRLPPISDERAAEITMLTVARVRALRVKMNRVRGMNLNHVGFRACNVGQSTETLDRFKEFFRCRSISAPDMRDTYAHFDPGGSVADVDAWAAGQRRHSRHVFVEGADGSKVGLATRGGEGHDTDYSIWFAAQSRQAVQDWVTLHMRDGYSSGQIIYHGLFRTTASATEARVLFIKDVDFLSHLVRRG